jgi:hypothetical protein
MRPIDIQRPMLRDGFQELRMSNPYVEEFKIMFAMKFLKSQLDCSWWMVWKGSWGTKVDQ